MSAIKKNTITIFLASSDELINDRNSFQALISSLDDIYEQISAMGIKLVHDTTPSLDELDNLDMDETAEIVLLDTEDMDLSVSAMEDDLRPEEVEEEVIDLDLSVPDGVGIDDPVRMYLKEIGKMRKPVLLKRGLANTLQELLMSAEYIMSGGNREVILCERGIRTFEPITRNTLDISAGPMLKRMTHLPIVVDIDPL